MASPRVSSRRRTPFQRRQPTATPNIFSRLFGWFQKSDSQPVPAPDDYDYDDDTDSAGKRRRTTRPVDDDQAMEDFTRPRAKRPRRESPVRQADVATVPWQGPVRAPTAPATTTTATSGYLDPPPFMISSTLAPSKPLLSGRSVKPVERTMSIDPPFRRSTRSDPAAIPLPLSRDPSMDVSPRPLRIRSTLTPARSGLDFGPVPQRRERDPSDPPPLTSLMSNPVFVKPPPREPRRVSDSSVSNTTLGALANQRSASIPRGHSTLVLPTASDGTKLRPVNNAEIALNHLEIYRTPLVPARLRSSVSSDVPLVEPMFQSREKAKHMVFLDNDRARKPRLGMANRIPAIEEASPKTTSERVHRDSQAKPYAGSGSVKKLLVRRRKEEKEEREKRETTPVDDYVTPPKHTSKIPFPPPTSAPVLSRKTSASLGEPSSNVASLSIASGRMPSMFHVGRGPSANGGGRSVGPTRRKRGRFTAVDDEDDESEVYPTGLESVKEDQAAESTGPKYEPPPGFSFAAPTTAAPQPTASPAHEATSDGPVTSLPFSLTPLIAPISATPASVGPEAPIAEAKPAAEEKATASSLTPAAEVKEQGAAAPTPARAEAPKPVIFAPTPAFSFTAPSNPPVSTTPSTLPFSLTPKPVEAKPAVPKPTEGKTAAEQQKPLFGNGFTGFTTPAPTSTPPPAPAPAAAPVPPKSPAPAAATAAPSNVEAPKPTFAFGAAPVVPAPAPSKTPAAAPSPAPAVEAPKPTFGGFNFGQPAAPAPASEKEQPKPSTPSPFTFGAAPATPPAAEKKQSFSFGAPSTPAAAPATGGFTFGTPAATTENKGFAFGAPATMTAAPTRPVTPPRGGDDGMRMDESPVRDLQPKLQVQVPFSFNTTSSSSTLFGNASQTSNAPTSNSFSFGAPKPADSTSSSGFAFGASKPAESSGGFNFGAKPAGGASTGGFTFGAQASKPAENLASPFAFSTGKPADPSPASPFAFNQSKPAEGASNGFGFGTPKPAENASNGFAFGASKPVESSTGFNFGAPKSAEPAASGPFAFGAAKPVEQGANAFGFGQTAAPAAPFGQATTPGSSPFAFGQPLPPQNGGGFGSSAPSSPAFGAPPNGGFGSNNANGSNAFAFAGPTSAPAQPSQPNPFTFNATSSQPASPAGGAGGFSFVPGSGNPPASPFSAGGSSPAFSMGSGVSLATTPNAPRQMKRLPTRKVTKRA